MSTDLTGILVAMVKGPGRCSRCFRPVPTVAEVTGSTTTIRVRDMPICQECLDTLLALPGVQVLTGEGIARAKGQSMNVADDPQWDGTDAAHPAWWRGNDAGVLATVRALERVFAEPRKPPNFSHADLNYLAGKIAGALLALEGAQTQAARLAEKWTESNREVDRLHAELERIAGLTP